jgi:hypothetical protein
MLKTIYLNFDLHVYVFLTPSLHVGRYYLLELIEHGIKLVESSVDPYFCLVHDSKVNSIHYF